MAYQNLEYIQLTKELYLNNDLLTFSGYEYAHVLNLPQFNGDEKIHLTTLTLFLVTLFLTIQCYLWHWARWPWSLTLTLVTLTFDLDLGDLYVGHPFLMVDWKTQFLGLTLTFDLWPLPLIPCQNQGHRSDGLAVRVHTDRLTDTRRHTQTLPVIAKYAGHVRQTSADVRQGVKTLPDILSSRVQYT